MMSEYIERHFDYVLGPNQDARLGSIAAGQSINGIVLQTELDAPFVLRSRAMRICYTEVNHDQAGLNHLLLRWYGQDRNYTSQNFIRQSLLGPYFGQIGNPISVHPERFYPPQSDIRVDIKNDGASTLLNLTLYFRGVKLFEPGAVKSYTYPEKFGLLPFTYPHIALAVPVTTPSTQGQRTVFLCKTDADFVLQGLQAGYLLHLDAAGLPVLEVSIKLKDEDEKPYSNDMVHADILCGNSGIGNIYSAGTNARISPVAGGPNKPGLVFPEIYIPKNHVFYIDVARADANFAGAAASDFPIALIGQKVFEK